MKNTLLTQTKAPFTSNFLLAILIIWMIGLTSLNSYSQNPSFQIMDEQVEPLSETDYFKAKKMVKSIEKKFKVDPAQKYLFLFKSLENKDIRYFKKEIKKLMKNHGFSYSRYTPPFSTTFTILINENGLKNWMFDHSEKLYSKWIRNNPKGFAIKQKINELKTIEDTRGYLGHIQRADSTCGGREMILLMDSINLSTILHIAESNNGILPNHFDHGVHTYYSWETCLWYNLMSTKMAENWNKILPYIEKTYFAGKIGDGLFRLYDQQLARSLGYQYYGFEKGVPVNDAEHLEERRKKYGFR